MKGKKTLPFRGELYMYISPLQACILYEPAKKCFFCVYITDNSYIDMHKYMILNYFKLIYLNTSLNHILLKHLLKFLLVQEAV